MIRHFPFGNREYTAIAMPKQHLIYQKTAVRCVSSLNLPGVDLRSESINLNVGPARIAAVTRNRLGIGHLGADRHAHDNYLQGRRLR